MRLRIKKVYKDKVQEMMLTTGGAILPNVLTARREDDNKPSDT